jgi:hypothetical protein
MSQVMVPTCLGSARGRAERLVVASGIDGELAEESAILIDDADVTPATSGVMRASM